MTTPIIAAALARKPRRNPRAIQRTGGEGGAKKPAHNHVAQAPKKQPGAPLGNRHAARYSLADVERQARLGALIQRVCATADAVIRAADQARVGRTLLAALLAEPRS